MLLEQQVENGPNIGGPGGAKASVEFVMLKKDIAGAGCGQPGPAPAARRYKGKPPFGRVQKWRHRSHSEVPCEERGGRRALYPVTLDGSVQGYLAERYDY